MENISQKIIEDYSEGSTFSFEIIITEKMLDDFASLS